MEGGGDHSEAGVVKVQTISKLVFHLVHQLVMEILYKFVSGSELPEIGISTLPTITGPEVKNSRSTVSFED